MLHRGGEREGLQVTVTDAAFEGGIVRYWLTVKDAQIELVAEAPVRAGDEIFPARREPAGIVGGGRGPCPP